MLKKAAIVAGAAASLLAIAPVAHADGDQDNDGINLLTNTNLSVLPVQACGNNIAVLGAVVPIGSPTDAQCVNAPEEQ